MRSSDGERRSIRSELERKVLLELFLDLMQKLGCYWTGNREYRDRDLRVAHHLLDYTGKGDDRTFVVEAGPQIDVHRPRRQALWPVPGSDDTWLSKSSLCLELHGA